MGIMQRIERLMFGATAEERVELQLRLMDQRIERRVRAERQALLAALAGEDDESAEDEGADDGRS